MLRNGQICGTKEKIPKIWPRKVQQIIKTWKKTGNHRLWGRESWIDQPIDRSLKRFQTNQRNMAAQVSEGQSISTEPQENLRSERKNFSFCCLLVWWNEWSNINNIYKTGLTLTLTPAAQAHFYCTNQQTAETFDISFLDWWWWDPVSMG